MAIIYSSTPRNGPGQWLENGYVILAQDGQSTVDGSFTQSASWITSKPDGSSGWVRHSQTGIDPSYLVSGMVRTTNGTLISLLFNPVTQRTKSCFSQDKGVTFKEADNFSEVIPQLEMPPCLACLGNTVVACWVDTTGQPSFAVSVDGEGQSWS